MSVCCPDVVMHVFRTKTTWLSHRAGRPVVWAVLVVLAVAWPAAGAADAAGAVAVDRGVVNITTILGYQSGAAAGTGMVLTASGELLTNNHVIRGATSIRVTDPANGRSYPATVLGYDLSADIAVLKLKGASGLKPIAIGDSSAVRIGDLVTAVGNAGGAGGAPSAAVGKVSALHRSIVAVDGEGSSERLSGLLETDASLQPGDSGGPLLNSAGLVIGMNTAATSGFEFQPGGG